MAVPTQLVQLRAQAFAALQQKRDADAAEMLTRYLDGVPDDREAELALAVARCGQGRFGPALVIFDRHLEKEPKSPALHFNKATALERMGKKFEATKAYEQVLKLKADHAKARQRLEALTGAKPKQAAAAVTPPPAVLMPPPPKPVSAPPPAAPMPEEIPEVVAIEDDEPVEVEAVEVAAAPARKKDRWIHPVWLAGLFVYAVTAIAVTGIFVSVYSAGRVAGEQLLANIFLLAGVQTLHGSRNGKKNSPVAVGWSLTMVGALLLICIPFDPVFSVIRANQAKENERIRLEQYAANQKEQQAEYIRQRDELINKKNAAFAAQQAEASKRQAENAEKARKARAEAVDGALTEIRSGDTNRIVDGCRSLATNLIPDRRAEVGPILEGLLTHAEAAVRQSTVLALATWGTQDTVAKLEPLLKDKNPVIRSTTARAIDRIKRRNPT
jgi:tetratricopeptide (TPR) repeat protein